MHVTAYVKPATFRVNVIVHIVGADSFRCAFELAYDQGSSFYW